MDDAWVAYFEGRSDSVEKATSGERLVPRTATARPRQGGRGQGTRHEVTGLQGTGLQGTDEEGCLLRHLGPGQVRAGHGRDGGEAVGGQGRVRPAAAATDASASTRRSLRPESAAKKSAPVPKETPPAPPAEASDEPTLTRAARRPGAHRAEHGRQPHGPDRDQRAHGAGQAAVGQPHRHQQPPRPRPRRQGLVHPPHRLRAGQGARDDAGDEQRLRRHRRQAQPDPARPHQPRPGHRPAEARRHPPAAGALDQGRRDDGLRRRSGRPTRTSSARPATASSRSPTSRARRSASPTPARSAPTTRCRG